MALNSTLIEKLAIGRVTRLFLTGGRINPFLAQEDKEPLWDGFLYLYSSEEWCNRDMKGRVACQVKGRDAGADSEQESYSVDVCDLENYLRDGGILFFLVHVRTEPEPSSVYWARLAPVDIRGYLNKAKDQKSITISLERVPEAKALEQEVFAFYEDCQRQRKEPVDVSCIANKMKFKTSFNVKPGELPILALTKGYHYLYTSDEQDGFGNPVGDSKFSFRIEKSVAEKITIGEQEFNVPVKLKAKDGEACLVFGRFMTMDLKRDDGDPCQLNYKVDKLYGVRERDIALKVLLALSSAERFVVAGQEYSCAEITVAPEIKKNIEEELAEIQRVILLLDRMHVKEDLSLSNLSEHEIRELNTLYSSVINNHLVKPDLIDSDYHILNVKIGPLTMKVWLVKEGDGYRAYDFFTADLVVAVATSDEERKHEVARFVLMEKKDYMHISNIDWSLIPSEYARIYKGDVEMLHQANQDVLSMLLAFDECGKKELLEASLRLTDWLTGICGGDEVGIYRVNHLQCIKRQRELTTEEQEEVIKLSESTGASPELKYCCSLLLNDIRRASFHYRSMPKNLQDFYRSLPINRFYKSLKKGNA